AFHVTGVQTCALPIFSRPVLAVHPRILPLDGQRPRVPDAVQRTYHPLEVDLAAAGRAEIPPAAAVAEIEMPAEDAAVARRVRPPRVLHVHMADARREALDERYVVNALVAEVARVEVEAERRVPVHGIERALRG